MFVLSSPGVHFELISAEVARGFEEPSGQNSGANESGRFARQGHEDLLRDFLGQLAIARLAQGGGVDESRVTLHDLCKRRLGALLNVPTQQIEILHCGHPPINMYEGEGR